MSCGRLVKKGARHLGSALHLVGKKILRFAQDDRRGGFGMTIRRAQQVEGKTRMRNLPLRPYDFAHTMETHRKLSGGAAWHVISFLLYFLALC